VNPKLDTTMTAEAKQDAKDAVHEAQTATREVVHETTTRAKKH
jgi:vacuolar-type H+-ATPase subunit H